MFCSSVTLVDNVLMVLPWFVTVLDKVLIALAFADSPVVELVIAALRDVIFIDVEIFALSLTPATNNISDAFCVMAVPFDVI